MRGELRELYEQEKRQCSIILRGFQTEDVEVIRKKVRDICLILNVDVFELEGLIKIDNTGLFRAKVLDRDLRSALLSNARNLRKIDQYKSVYIQRDLTYKQRQSLNQRRATRFASHDVGTGQRGRGDAAGRTESLSRGMGGLRRGVVTASDRLDSFNCGVNDDQTGRVRQRGSSVRVRASSRRGGVSARVGDWYAGVGGVANFGAVRGGKHGR